MGIANSILDKAQIEVLRHPGAHLLKVGVRIGEWSGVEPESLRFCFDCLVSGAAPPLPGAAQRVHQDRGGLRSSLHILHHSAASREIPEPAV